MSNVRLHFELECVGAGHHARETQQHVHTAQLGHGLCDGFSDALLTPHVNCLDDDLGGGEAEEREIGMAGLSVLRFADRISLYRETPSGAFDGSKVWRRGRVRGLDRSWSTLSEPELADAIALRLVQLA